MLTLKNAVVAVVVTVCGIAAQPAQASPQHHGSPSYRNYHPSYHHNYHVNYGHRFSHGYYFSGSYYRHFSYRMWNSRYRCYFYYYPGTSNYYYWSGTNNCYYPTTYINVVVPNGPPPAGIMDLPLQQQGPPMQPGYQQGPPMQPGYQQGPPMQPGYQPAPPVVQPGYQGQPMPVPYPQY